jgi:hypothetical protein
MERESPRPWPRTPGPLPINKLPLGVLAPTRLLVAAPPTLSDPARLYKAPSAPPGT